MLLARDLFQVAVYSINDYQLLRHLSVPGLKPCNDNDMTSCVRYKCLYMSDYNNSCIHRYDLRSSAIMQWRVPGSPVGLSITPSCNLLVTCRDTILTHYTYTGRLVELSADSGQCVREITLRPDIVRLSHSAQLTTGQYVVCHGDWNNIHHRVCLIGDDGKVTRSYSGQHDYEVRKCHLAVDKDSQFIFVADECNHRVELLSPTLEFVRYVIEKLTHLCRLYLDQATQRLFVGRFGNVVVIQL